MRGRFRSPTGGGHAQASTTYWLAEPAITCRERREGPARRLLTNANTLSHNHRHQHHGDGHTARHRDKEVQEAIDAILTDPWWRLEQKTKTGHVWGTLYCGLRDRAGCKIWIHSTPEVPSSHARKLLKEARSCPHNERDT
jgi:hypothetical protein